MTIRAVCFFIFSFFLSGLLAQVQEKVDFIRATVWAEPLPETKQLRGRVTYTFRVLQAVDSIYLNAQALNISTVQLNTKNISFSNTGKVLIVHHPFTPKSTHSLTISYTATPRQTLYFVGWEDEDPSNNQIWTQGQGKYTSHWLPGFDDMEEKVAFDLQLRVDTAYTVVANGRPEGRTTQGNTTTWKYSMKHPMSSYLVGFAIGKWNKKVRYSSSEVPLYLYYAPRDSLRVEPTYRYTERIFDFLERKIGVPYPWQNYKQVPVKDFLYAGMENTGATFFSESFMVDSIAFVDTNYVNVNAHELAHQWFGNWVTEQSAADHWLHEGFATYYAYLAEQELFGDDAFYWRLWETAQTLAQHSREGQGEALTQATASSLTFYEKGAWALLLLQEQVGDTTFAQGIQRYLTTYACKNATLPEFMAEMEAVANVKLTAFKKQWLYSPAFPEETAKRFLETHSPSVKKYGEITGKIGSNPLKIETVLQQEWPLLQSQHLKYQLLMKYGTQLSATFRIQLLQTEALPVRQAVALTTDPLSPALQPWFELLLYDNSYRTQEVALYKLCTYVPQQRAVYLDRMEDAVGFPNKNLRLLWLALALATPDYRPDAQPRYRKELNHYTNPQYAVAVRQLAFEYLTPGGRLTDETFKNLVNACIHPVWQFRKTGRRLLKTLLQNKKNKTQLKTLYPSLKEEEQTYINQLLTL